MKIGVRKSLESLASKAHPLFRENGVVLAYLFGSQARGRAGRHSDVDVAVLLDRQVPPEEWSRVQVRLTNALMDLFHRNDVDVVILNRACPLLAQQVLRYGRCLYAESAAVRVRFAVETLHRYEDTRNLRRIRRHYLGRRIAAGRAIRASVPPREPPW